MGAITNVVKRYVPASYRAMIGPSEMSEYYALSELQDLANYVQFKLLATIAGATEEGSVYDPVMLEFLGKVTTIKFIPAAIDYWLDQYDHETTTGTNETRSFPSRLAHLREVYAELTKDVAAEFKTLFGGLEDAPAVSYGDGGRGILRTPDPRAWPKPFELPLPGSAIWDVGPFLPWDFLWGP